MKKLGLIGGMGYLGTCEYYKEVMRIFYEKNGLFPEISVESLDYARVKEYCQSSNFSALEKYVSEKIKNLAYCGAQAAAVAADLPYIVFEDIKKNSPIPVADMQSAAAERAAAKGVKRAVVLGSEAAVINGVFKKAFDEKGIKTIVPAKHEISYISGKIENELIFGETKKETRRVLGNIVRRIAEEERADAVVWGCAELSAVFKDINLPVIYIDAAKINIEKISELISK